MSILTKQAPRILPLFLGALILLTSCSNESDSAESSEVPADPFAQMEIAFEGSPRQATIRSAMDAAFDAVGTPEGAREYDRAGSVLVAFRKEYGISEMDILECIPHRANSPRAPKKDFPNVAAVCLTDLASGVTVP